MIGALAKGSKRPKSSFGGPLDLLYLGEAGIVFRPRSGLHLLTTFHVVDTFTGIRAGLPRFHAAAHLLEILIGMAREEEPHRPLFDLLAEGLAELNGTSGREILPLLAALELAALRELGFSPNLGLCSSCEAPVPRRAWLSVREGGVLCENCRDRDPGAEAASPGALRTLRALEETPPSRSRRIRLSAPDGRRIRAFLTDFEEWRMERRLRAARYLG
jgi:DNA repair protein RecO (recombination protein O)